MLPLGCYAWFGYLAPLDERLGLIKQAGFEATGLWFEAEEEIIRVGRTDDMPQMVRDQGLVLDNIHAPFWNSRFIWSDSEELRAKAWIDLESTLAFCGRYKIPRMVMHAAGAEVPSAPPQSGLAMMRDLVRQAEDLGVTIALENVDDGSAPYHADVFLDFLFSEIQSPNLAFCYDSGHDYLSVQLRGGALERWGHLLVGTHFSDHNGINDDHFLPGRGTIDWTAVRQSFPNGYEGTLMLEVEVPDLHGLTPEGFLRAGQEWLRGFAEGIDQ